MPTLPCRLFLAWVAFCLPLKLFMAATSSIASELADKANLEPVKFADLNGWRSHRALDVWPVFLRSCRHILTNAAPLRPAIAMSASLVEVCKKAELTPAPVSHRQARAILEDLFQPYAINHIPGQNPYEGGFLTGYYEPVVRGSMIATSEFTEPVFGRPTDLVSDVHEIGSVNLPAGITGARRTLSGKLEPYPERAMIENEGVLKAVPPLLWVRDGIELFMIQVQGSARIRLTDGRTIRLVYAGRNGQPYTSIGRILVEQGLIARDEMSLARLKTWVRANGQKPGEAGRLLMQQNKSYVFFRVESGLASKLGPIGGAGVPLTPMRSIAVDRSIWPYGLPFWIDAEIPWRERKLNKSVPLFQRLMVAQDTGSAIVGAARADIYFGSGSRAGRLAGNIRHPAKMFVLMPRVSGKTDE